MGVELVHIKQTHLLFGKFQPHVVMKKKVLKALQKRENLLPSGGSYLFSFKGYNNKSNGVRTTDAFSLVLVPLHHTFTCHFVLLLLTSNSDSHTFLFQTLI